MNFPRHDSRRSRADTLSGGAWLQQVARAWWSGIAALAALAAAGESRAAGAATLPEWSLQLLYGENEIYPSALVSVTNSGVFPPRLPGFWQLGDPSGLIGVQLRAPRDDYPVNVVLEPTALYDRTELSVRLPKQGQLYRVAPWLKLDHARLVAIRQPIAGEPIRAHLTAEGITETKVDSVRIHGIADCLTTVYQGGLWYETAFLAAAYINEFDAEVIDPITRLALARGYVDSFDGYNSGDRKKVERQVEAIYRTLQDLGFKFSKATESSVPYSRKSMSQAIRLNRGALTSQQANCVDGTALFAAIVTRVQLRAVMFFIVHEHIFLGVYLTPDGGEDAGFIEVETTAMGYYPFAVARKAGRDKLAQIRRSHREVRLDHGPLKPLIGWDDRIRKGEKGFYTIDVRTARERGIWPIPNAGVTQVEEVLQ